jgi:predicted PurR-regulated permease PerM
MPSAPQQQPPGGSSILTPDVDPGAQAAPADAAAPTPDLARTEAALQSPAARSASVTILAVLAVFYTLFFARDFLMPIAFALLLDFLLSPVVRALRRLRVPTPIGAAVVVLGVVGLLTLGIYELSGPVQRWAAEAPKTLAATQARARTILRPLERVTETAEQVEQATSVGGGGGPAEVVVRGPSLVSQLFGTTQRLITRMLEVFLLLYFLLAAGDLFLQKLIKVLPLRSEKRKAVEIARATESSVSTYLLTTALMNVGEGVVVGVAMYLLGMPNPALWGALVAVLEFIPYLGALTMVVILSAAALTTFDSVGHALLVPATFLAINLVQANVVYPTLLGHRLELNPVAILVGLSFWYFAWGIPGAFLAVPLLATFKIFCDHIESLAAVGEFLGQRDEAERRTTVRPP